MSSDSLNSSIFNTYEALNGPPLPPGVEYLKDSKEREIEASEIRDKHKELIHEFSAEIAEEILNNGRAQIIIPVSGGLLAYTDLIRTLHERGIDISKLDVVFAYKGADGKYAFHKDVEIGVKTFLIDDIIDSKKSYWQIKRLFLGAVGVQNIPEKDVNLDSFENQQFVARYLSTKKEVVLPPDCNQNPYVYRKEWLANTFGMDKGHESFTDPDVRDQAILYNSIIEAYERLHAKPIVKDFDKREDIEKWSTDEVRAYFAHLDNPADWHHSPEEKEIRDFLINTYLRLNVKDDQLMVLKNLHQHFAAILGIELL